MVCNDGHARQCVSVPSVLAAVSPRRHRALALTGLVCDIPNDDVSVTAAGEKHRAALRVLEVGDCRTVTTGGSRGR